MESSIHRFFAPAEVRQLEAGLPRLGEWSATMLVPFQARRLRHATVLWINRRWFLERQIDVTRDDVRKRVSSWLLDDFACEAFADGARTLHADRYGSSTGRTFHGGSGRVATIGCYQAKGIGVTPLVGVGGDAEHATGWCSVEEGIREAIFSEVAAAEFPHGAVPVVAILDSGLGVGRGIVVRPAVLRLAHAERAPLFMRSVTGYANSQLDDVRRTRDVFQRWSPDLSGLVSRIAEQVAFGQVHRLFSGGYFSSNLSVDGALLDFGGMRALPNWVNARNLDVVAGFGDEMKIVDKLIESLGFYFRKYRAASVSTAALRSQAKAAHTRAFTRECLRMWGLDAQTDPTLTDAVMRALSRYFSCQQKFRVNYKRGGVNDHGWLYNARAASIETETLNAIDAALHRHFANFPDREERALQAWSCAARYLMPRESLDREKLKQSIERRLESSAREWIADFVRSAVGRGRRHWPRLPSDLTVQAHVAYEGSSALLCLERSSRRQVYWLEGIRVHDSFRLFDSCITVEQARDLGAQADSDRWSARVSISGLRAALSIRIPELQMDIGSLHLKCRSMTGDIHSTYRCCCGSCILVVEHAASVGLT
jgi:hypothetical protein